MSYASGKVALVTGGASGIGLSIIKEMLKNGLKGATIADIASDVGEEIAHILSEQFGQGRIIYVKTDVTSQKDVENAFEKTVETFKHLDIVVNSAGVFDEKNFEKSVAVNLVGTIRTSFLAFERYLPRYKSSSEALLINISSICGLNEYGWIPVYVATKHGVIGFSRSLGTDEHYKRTQVRVLILCPSVTDTPIIITEDDQFYNSFYANMDNTIEKRPMQKPEVVAEVLEKIVREGETGSAWIIEGGIIEKITFPDFLTSCLKTV